MIDVRERGFQAGATYFTLPAAIGHGSDNRQGVCVCVRVCVCVCVVCVCVCVCLRACE